MGDSQDAAFYSPGVHVPSRPLEKQKKQTTLFFLKRVQLDPNIHIVMTGSEDDEYYARQLVGAVEVCAKFTRHTENQHEFPGILYTWQLSHTTEWPICYCHLKGVSVVNPVYTKWRWMMATALWSDWQSVIQSLTDYDVIGCCYLPSWPCLAGNWWIASSEWLRQRPEPIQTTDRFYYEKWVVQPPSPKVLSLIDSGVSPYVEDWHLTRGQPGLKRNYIHLRCQ